VGSLRQYWFWRPRLLLRKQTGIFLRRDEVSVRRGSQEARARALARYSLRRIHAEKLIEFLALAEKAGLVVRAD
jgi:hypothetical protein